MKRIVLAITAVAALAACTKSEVAYEAPAEICFTPTAKNITKAAITDGVYPTQQPLAVYAAYGNVEPETVVNDDNVSDFSTAFLNDANFTYKTVGSISAWGGGYSWPNNGSLIFAGYSKPVSGEIGTSRTYNFESDVLTINGYTQSTSTASTFDLGWYGRTAKSYNYRNVEDAVDVTLSHALSLIEIRAYGEGTPVAEGNPWQIKSITMNNVANTGTVSCTGAGVAKATWSQLGTANNDIAILTTQKPLTKSETTVYEDVTAGTIVIPQTPTAVDTKNPGTADTEVATLTVTYTYKSPASTSDNVIWMPDQTTTVSLQLTDAKDKNGNPVTGGWKSGYKYIYTLKFKGNEILVAPSYEAWTEASQNITVE